MPRPSLIVLFLLALVTRPGKSQTSRDTSSICMAGSSRPSRIAARPTTPSDLRVRRHPRQPASPRLCRAQRATAATNRLRLLRESCRGTGGQPGSERRIPDAITVMGFSKGGWMQSSLRRACAIPRSRSSSWRPVVPGPSTVRISTSTDVSCHCMRPATPWGSPALHSLHVGALVLKLARLR
jgi:hypothetical protein